MTYHWIIMNGHIPDVLKDEFGKFWGIQKLETYKKIIAEMEVLQMMTSRCNIIGTKNIPRMETNRAIWYTWLKKCKPIP